MGAPFVKNKLFNQMLSRRFFSIGLRKLLLCFFICVAVIPILFLGTWVYNNTLRAEIHAVEEKHLLLSENISNTLSSYSNELRAIFIAESEAAQVPVSPEIEAVLRSVNIQMLAVATRNVNLEFEPTYALGSEQLLPSSGMMALRTECRKAFAYPGRVVFSPVILSAQEQPSIYLLRVTRKHRLAIAAIDTAYFRQIQREVIFGKGGHAAIVDQEGRAIAHPFREWENTAHNMSHLEPVRMMINTQGRGIAKFYSGITQADMIAGYTTVPETGWGVMIPQPFSEIRARARHTKIMALWISGTGMLLAIVVSWRLTKFILGPIQSVINAARALETGQPIHRLNINQKRLPRELYQLLHTFDQMAQEVSAVRATLEDRVEERTRELVTEVERRKALEEQLIRQATHDALTGLPNRRLLTERLQAIKATSVRSRQPIALLFLDLDGFKAVNDRYGHQLGDDLLVQVSNRLRYNLRKTDCVFRLGGDEFVILLEQVSSTADVSGLADNLLTILQQRFMIQGYEIYIGASIGVKISQFWERESIENILSDADSAMYKAKESGNCSMLYQEISA